MDETNMDNIVTSFTKANDKMIATNDNAYRTRSSGTYFQIRNSFAEYDLKQICEIVESGSIQEQQKLSRYFFNRDGYYKQILTYYATLSKYAGLLIPQVRGNSSLSSPHISKRYEAALTFVEELKAPIFFTNCAIRALRDGCYYGVRANRGKDSIAIIDLPPDYCITRFKDARGNDLIEFNLAFFDSIKDEQNRKAALETFPKDIVKAYRAYHKGKIKEKWYFIPSDLGVCFPLFDGRPPLLHIIPKSLTYDEAVANELDREANETSKIIVQQIPHLADGRLLFEPDEAAEIHTGTVGMLKGNKKVSVLTTYGDVNAIQSQATHDNVEERLARIEQNIYAEAGVSSEIFAATMNSSLKTTLQNDLAFMMPLINQFSNFLTMIINTEFGNTNISFKYTILPISYYNQDDFVDTSFKLVGSGYSFLMPAIALGLTQRDLSNVKDLENELLKLNTKLRPLATSYTQSGSSQTSNGEEGGRPQKDELDKTDRTLQNEESAHSD